jgi:hypothetical protein
MTLSDPQVIAIVNELLAREGVHGADRMRYVRERKSVASLPALAPLVDRYLAIVDPPRTCQVEHGHWEGKMICGNPLPCRTHGGGY